MTNHCKECGSRICNHGNCPECRPCTHCFGGDREDKYFGEDADREMLGSDADYFDLGEIGNK